MTYFESKSKSSWSTSFALNAWVLLVSPLAFSALIETNAAKIENAPAWLKAPRVEKVIDRVERALEWDIRKVRVIWYQDQDSFVKAHGLGPAVLAFTRKSENTISMGPQVNPMNFDGIFGHELGHVIIAQKYKTAIPAWLEEGLSNWAAKNVKIDYAWLKSQTPKSVQSLVHPFENYSTGADQSNSVRYHYQASTALAEMLAKQCGMHDLLQLSVQRKLENYLKSFCKISDLDQALRVWIQKKAP
jgi:hypothetical protein